MEPEGSLSLDHIPSHMNPAHSLTTYFFKTHYNIILPSIHGNPYAVWRFLDCKYNVLLEEVFIVSEEPTASFFRIEVIPEDGGKKFL
jgi:hypothetical protein